MEQIEQLQSWLGAPVISFLLEHWIFVLVFLYVGAAFLFGAGRRDSGGVSTDAGIDVDAGDGGGGVGAGAGDGGGGD